MTQAIPFRLALLATLLAFVSGCADKTHIPSEIVFEYRQQFRPGQIKPGWNLVSVGMPADRGTALVHKVHVPPEVAGELMLKSGRDRARAIAQVACPTKDHDIWSRLEPYQDVVVEAESENGTFDVISCRVEAR